MGWGRAFRYEPEGARELEQRESRGGGGASSMLGRDGRRGRVGELTATGAGATSVFTLPRMGSRR